VLCPPSALNDRWSRRLPEPITAMASGWMRVRQRARQRGVELPLVISDHADWTELTQTIERGKPGRDLGHARARGGPAALVPASPAAGAGAGSGRLRGRGRLSARCVFRPAIDALVYTSIALYGKLKLIVDYLRATPDPDRGWALAALTGALDFPAVKSATIRNLMTARVDPVLYALSRDYVGDTAETASLLWPEPEDPRGTEPNLNETVQALSRMTRVSVMSELPRLLDRLDANGRYALIKLATGAMRIGISARLAKLAFAQAFDVAVEEVEEHWHGQEPPYTALFAWAAHGAPAPSSELIPLFRPFMLAHPLEDTVVDLSDAFAETWAAEWKWDGIRVQIVHAGGETRSIRARAMISPHTFPEVAAALDIPAVLDGELLVRGSHQGGEAMSRAARPASTRFSSGWAARRVARPCWLIIPLSCASTTC
jgi:hypothetical protein